MQKEKLVILLQRSRKYIGLIVIAATVVAFVWYLNSHPNSLDPLQSTPLYLLPLLIALYVLFLITNFLVTTITINLSKKTYPLKEALMLTIYSTLVNFFGPLQSGPGFRAIYLKKKIGLSIKTYTFVTMLYYAAFLVISLVMMFGMTYPLPTLAFIFTVGLIGLWFFRNQKLARLIRNFAIIGVVTLSQLLIIAFVYYLELRATGYSPSLSSTLTYTGSANLALFVAVTPGAIGIRESFLYLSQALHNIPTEYIINASLLDRAVYIIFLGLLFVISSSLHIKRKLRSVTK